MTSGRNALVVSGAAECNNFEARGTMSEHLRFAVPFEALLFLLQWLLFWRNVTLLP